MAYEDEYVIRKGIAYRKNDSYAYCDRCGSRPIVNHKCLNCDISSSAQSQRLADLINRFCHLKNGLDIALVAKIIEVSTKGVEVTQATNQDYE